MRQQLPERYDSFFNTDDYQLFGGFDSYHSLLINAKKVGFIMRESGADIALGMMHYPAALITLGARLAKLPIRTIASFRGPFYEYMRYHETGWRRRSFLRMAITGTTLLADRIIVPSQGTRQELSRRFLGRKRKTIVIPNGIDRNKVEEAAQWPVHETWLLNDNPHPVICAVARLAPEKNLQLLLDAVCRVINKRQIRLIILGEGPERAQLEAMINAKKLNQTVSLIGYRDNVYPYLVQADLFIHTCLFEGFGYTLLESMACGTPVIATDCPYGPREVIGDNRYGVLVPCHDPEKLADAILRLLLDDHARESYRVAGLKRAKELSIERMIRSYEKVFTELASEKAVFS